MAKALIIGAGGVAQVAAHVFQHGGVFTDLCIASRTKARCDGLKAKLDAKGTDVRISTAK